MRGDPLDNGFGLTSWRLILLILILVAMALLDVNGHLAAIVESVTGWL
jgi:hypothetical protein